MDNLDSILKMFSSSMSQDPSKLESVLGMLKDSGVMPNSNHASENSENSDSFDMPDIETIMKIKKVMDALKNSSDDPRSNLLLSLKPYLRDSKKDKLDQYIKIMSLTNAFSIFSDLDGDSK